VDVKVTSDDEFMRCAKERKELNSSRKTEKISRIWKMKEGDRY